MRQPKTAIEYASRVGSAAYDLYGHGDSEAEKALALLWHVNPELLSWLTERLEAVKAQLSANVQTANAAEEHP